MKENYINFVLEEFVSDENFNSIFGDNWINEQRFARLASEVCDAAFATYGIIANGRYSSQVMDVMQGMIGNAIVREGDEYSGFWYKLRPAHKAKYIDQLRAHNPATARLNQLGEPALERALRKIAAEDELGSLDEDLGGDLLSSDLPSAMASGPDPQFFSLDENRGKFISESDRQLEEVEKADLSNADKSQVRGYILAVKALADTPDPPTDIIWTILSRANSLAGIGSFVLSLIMLLAAVG